MASSTHKADMMARRWRLNVALALIVLLLAGLLLLRQWHERESAKPKLTTLDTTAVTKLVLERPRKPTLVFEREPAAAGGESKKETNGQIWRLTEPLRARANQFNVEALLEVAAAQRETELPYSAAQATQYGLDPPQASLALGATRVDFGAAHPLNDQYYVRVDDKLYLIAGRYGRAISYPESNFIDTRLLAEGRTLTSIRLAKFALVLKDGAWQRQPPDKALSSDRINDFVQEWQNARALSVEQGRGGRALGSARLRFAQSPEELVIDVLAEKPELVLYRRDEGLRYLFPEHMAKRLLSLP